MTPSLSPVPRHAGLASALITAAQQLGGGVGAATLNALATLVSSPSATPAALVNGYRAAALAGAALLGGAAFLASRLDRAPS